MAHSKTLGGAAILVSQNGLTLYHLIAEKGKKIVCTGQCATFWPPLLIAKGSKPTATKGVTAKKLGTIHRPDGRYQVTYAGFPLYRYSGDHKAGQVNGEGVENSWFAVSTAGKVVKLPAG